MSTRGGASLILLLCFVGTFFIVPWLFPSATTRVNNAVGPVRQAIYADRRFIAVDTTADSASRPPKLRIWGFVGSSDDSEALSELVRRVAPRLRPTDLQLSVRVVQPDLLEIYADQVRPRNIEGNEDLREILDYIEELTKDEKDLENPPRR